jgi:hypothetical protein
MNTMSTKAIPGPWQAVPHGTGPARFCPTCGAPLVAGPIVQAKGSTSTDQAHRCDANEETPGLLRARQRGEDRP